MEKGAALRVTRTNGEPVSLTIRGHEFYCEGESGLVTVPKEYLAGVCLSDIPEDISIKPVEKIEGNTIHVENDITISAFDGKSATASVEELYRRKFWDGEVGLTPFVGALRQSVAEHDDVTETDFQDDGDYVFLFYDFTIPEDKQVLDAVNEAEMTIASIHERAEQLVKRRRDPLLNIFDRGSFDADLAHALIKGHPVGLVFVDVDHFKQVNDEHGHQVGDTVLRTVADTIVQQCPVGATPYRYGGEEIAIVVRDTMLDELVRLAEALRAGIEQQHFQNPPLRVTASFGVALSNAEPEALLKMADNALYRAKNEGRNCVRASS